MIVNDPKADHTAKYLTSNVSKTDDRQQITGAKRQADLIDDARDKYQQLIEDDEPDTSQNIDTDTQDGGVSKRQKARDFKHDLTAGTDDILIIHPSTQIPYYPVFELERDGQSC